MGFADLWNRTLVYFGIAEEDEYWDEGGYATEDIERTYSERPNVRRLPRLGRDEYEEWSDTAETAARPAGEPPLSRRWGGGGHPGGTPPAPGCWVHCGWVSMPAAYPSWPAAERCSSRVPAPVSR